MTNPQKIWLTRPREDSETIAAALAPHGIASVIAPVMEVETCTPELDIQNKPGALILTSRYAAAAIPQTWRALPVFCVGEATADAARALGCTRAQGGEGDVLALLPMLARQLAPATRVVYFSGEEVRLNITALAASKNLAIERHIAYKAHAQTHLPEGFAAQWRAGEIGTVACFSPRSAQIVCQLIEEAALTDGTHDIEMIAMSLAVAAEAGALPWKALHACATPTAEAMVELIVSRMNPKML